MADEIDRALRFMKACGIDTEAEPPAARGRLLHQPRGADPRLRGGAHPPRLADRATGTTARPTCCGSASAPASLDGAHLEFLSGVGNPLGVQDRPDRHARRGRGALRAPRPRPHAGPADAHQPHGRRATSTERAAAAPARGPRGRPPRGVGLRPDARQHLHRPSGRKTRHFDDVLAEITGFFACAGPRGPGRAASTSSSPATTSPSAWAAPRRSSTTTSGTRYETTCDPRLNARQSLDLAFRVAELLA